MKGRCGDEITLGTPPTQVLVVDEAHRLKNNQSKVRRFFPALQKSILHKLPKCRRDSNCMA